MERRDESALAPRITFAHGASIEASVGDIDPAAARDSDFGQKLGAAFVNRNFIRRVRPCACDRGKESGRAATDDRDLFRHSYKTSWPRSRNSRESACAFLIANPSRSLSK